MGRILEGCREDVKRQPHSYWSTVRLPAEAETKLDVDVIERIAAALNRCCSVLTGTLLNEALSFVDEHHHASEA